MIKRLLLTLSLLASGAQAAVDLTAKPASGTYTFNSSWTGANGAVEPTTYYHIDEGSGATLDDLGSEAADGTITGADWVTDGSAAALDCVSANADHIDNLAAWGIANTSSDWTVAVLVSIDSGASSDAYFSLGDTTLTANNANQELMYGGIGASTHTTFNRYHGGTAQTDTGASYTATTWQLMWYQWTASTRTLKVYTDNGTEDAGISLVVTSGQQVPDAADGRLCADASSGVGSTADARIAGVYIWKSTALTAAQMQDVCNWNGTECEPWPFLTPSGSCPATCVDGPSGPRSARCITDISDASDADNILYGLSPAAVANEDTVCYDATSVLGDTTNVTTAGWPSIASGGSQLTDSFDYCIMDNGDPCGTDGTYEVTFQPVITSVTGIGTGQTTGTVTVTPAGPTEGTVYTVVVTKSSYDTYGAPSHAEAAAGQDGNGAAATFADNDPAAAENAFSATGLSAGSTYRACGAWENEATPPLTATVVCSAEWSTTAAGDTTPDAFAFTDLTGQPLGSTITSDAITVSSTDAPAVVTISGDPSCVYAINGGSYVATEGSADATDTITLQVTTEGLYSDQFSCQLTVGGVSDIWYVTTLAEPSEHETGIKDAVESGIDDGITDGI